MSGSTHNPPPYTALTMRLSFALLLLAATLPATTLQAQWDIEESHTTASLRGIQNVGGGVAWASGTNGTVLRTEDGGYLWQTCATPPGAEKLDFRGIQAFDENTAIVMSSGKGDLSRLYKTTDGCKTWKLLFTNPDKEGFWDAIEFGLFEATVKPKRNYNRGVLLGDPVDGKFVIFTTDDKGDNWKPWLSDAITLGKVYPAEARKGESLFAASNSAMVSPGIYGPFVFVTGGEGGARVFSPEPHSPFDNGIKWKYRTIRLPITSSETSGAFSIASRPDARNQFTFDFVIVGGDYKHPDEPGSSIFIPARNYGFFGPLPQTTEKSATPPHGYRSAVAYDEKTKTWITVGPNGTDISRDDGKNWTPLKPGPLDQPDADKNWNALSLPFVVGPNGRIGKLRPSALKP